MAGKRNKGQREEDKKRISELFVKGFSLRKIAEKISSERPYTLGPTQIKYDLDKVFKDWKEEAIQNVADRQMIEVRKLTKVESEAWIAYEDTRSARFLEIVLKCIEKRCRIFGIEEVPETYNERQIIVVTLPTDGADNASDEDQ